MISTKRIYETAEKSDGFRILVDRLWPRGISKEKAKIGLWVKGIAPSDGLRKWFSHDAAKWRGFSEKYAAELRSAEKRKLLAEIKRQEKLHSGVTLLFAAKDEEHNNAIVLKKALQKPAKA